MDEIADTPTENEPSRGVPYARKLILMAIDRIERRAAPSALKDDVLALLRSAEHHTWRNVTKQKSRRVSRPMTPDLVKDILLATAARPTASNKELAEQFGVQAGRITEVRQGKYQHLLSKELRSVLGDMRIADNDVQLPLPKVRRAA